MQARVTAKHVVRLRCRLSAHSSALTSVVARLCVGAAEFWVADESPQHLNFSPESLGGGSVRMVMIVEDPDTAFERAVAAGAAVVSPVGNRYGWRLGRIVDPFGHHWEIGKPLSEDS
jgi:PhnB protein